VQKLSLVLLSFSFFVSDVVADDVWRISVLSQHSQFFSSSPAGSCHALIGSNSKCGAGSVNAGAPMTKFDNVTYVSEGKKRCEYKVIQNWGCEVTPIRYTRGGSALMHFTQDSEDHCEPPGQVVTTTGAGGTSNKECRIDCSPSSFDSVSRQCGQPNNDQCGAEDGNPINMLSGVKIQRESDYQAVGLYPLTFTRTYNSKVNKVHTNTGLVDSSYLGNVVKSRSDYVWEPVYSTNPSATNFRERFSNVHTSVPAPYQEGRYGSFTYNGSVEKLWRHNYQQYLNYNESRDLAIFFSADGYDQNFQGNAGIYTNTSGQGGTLTKNINPDDSFTWTYQTKQSTVDFDQAGRPTTITNVTGLQHHLAFYPDTTEAYGQLHEVTDDFNNKLIFTYDDKERIETLTTPTSSLTYHYDHPIDETMMTSVSYGAGISKIYHYEDTRFPRALTGITDKNGDRYATWEYEDSGKATLSTHALGSESTGFAYEQGSVTLTNALGKKTTYNLIENTAYNRIGTVDGLLSGNCAAANRSNTYDSNGFRDQVTDWEGNITDYDYNHRGLIERIISAFGTADAFTVETIWHPTEPLPAIVTIPGSTTNYTYDANNRIATKTIVDTTTHTLPYSTAGNQRNWIYTTVYHTGTKVPASITIDGPRTDVIDVTTQTFNTQGQLISSVNALGHEVKVLEYHALGLPTIIENENGIQTHYTYNPRGKVLTETINDPVEGDTVTIFTYDDEDQLETITPPDTNFQEFEYDEAHRLGAVVDAETNRQEYTPDAAGNIRFITTKQSTGEIVYSQERRYDELSRLLHTLGNKGQDTSVAYDKNGNATDHNDALGHASINKFDALNRKEKITAADTGEIDFDYDGMGNLNLVSDPRDLDTGSVFDGFGKLIQQTSPDTGTVIFRYDAAGNLINKIDARSVEVAYVYDELNRLTDMTYTENSSKNVHYTYDDVIANPYAKGRLTSVSDITGTTHYVYDQRGRIAVDQRVITAQTYDIGYQYNKIGALIKITYPSGRVVEYKRDDLMGRVTEVVTRRTETDADVVLANTFEYLPFGPLIAFDYGNGLQRSVPYDLDYQLKSLNVGDGSLINLSYEYDVVGNIKAILDLSDATRSKIFEYDTMNRLSDAYSQYGAETDHIHYDYDLVGNRKTKTMGLLGPVHTTETYTYSDISNQLDNLEVVDSSGTSNRIFTYGDAGNLETEITLSGAIRRFIYAEDNRLVNVLENSLLQATYQYNALGQRVIKTIGSTTTHFHYGLSGELLAEAGGNGDVTREYIYLQGQMIAMVDIPKTIGFESGTFDGGEWTHDQEQPWTVSNTKPHSGSFSIQSGAIVAGQQSSLETTVETLDGTVSFYLSTSTGSADDKLVYYIDGVEQGQWSGDTGYQLVEFTVTEGEHTFTWVYVKDATTGGGQDTVWIDDIIIPSVDEPAIEIINTFGDIYTLQQHLLRNVEIAIPSFNQFDVYPDGGDGQLTISDLWVMQKNLLNGVGN